MDYNYKVSRFVNIDGVTCYMNSILSILQQTPLFSDWILNLDYKNIVNNEDINLEDSIIFNFYKLMITNIFDNKELITPRSFRDCLTSFDSMWGEVEHQDSQELLNFIITKMEEEISTKIMIIYGKKKYNKNLNCLNPLLNIIAKSNWEKLIQNEFSPIKILFSGMYFNSINCTYCNNVSNNFELFQNIQLHIPDSKKKLNLFDLLDCYTTEEQLDSDNMITCCFCKKKNRSKKKINFWKLPEILVFQLKRFQFNNYGIMSTKIDTHIDYPICNLNLNKYLSKNIKEDYTYNLFAVNLHQNLGMGINLGHYTSLVKNRCDKKWYLYNDDKMVNQINNINKIINKDAYLLFYFRQKNSI